MKGYEISVSFQRSLESWKDLRRGVVGRSAFKTVCSVVSIGHCSVSGQCDLKSDVVRVVG